MVVLLENRADFFLFLGVFFRGWVLLFPYEWCYNILGYSCDKIADEKDKVRYVNHDYVRR